MPDDRWPRGSANKPVEGPPCEKCGSDRSERYRSGMDTIRCVNARGCAERVRTAERV